MKIQYINHNRDQFKATKEDVKALGIELVLSDIQMPELGTGDLEASVRHTASDAYQKSGGPVLARDGGFYVYLVSELPTRMINLALDTFGMAGILPLMVKGQGECEFRECLAYIDGRLDTPQLFYSKTGGTIRLNKEGRFLKKGKIFTPHGGGEIRIESDERLDWAATPYASNAPVEKFKQWYVSNR